MFRFLALFVPWQASIAFYKLLVVAIEMASQNRRKKFMYLESRMRKG